MKADAAPLPAGGRDLRFDSLRGLLLVCMTINHLPSPLRLVTDQSLGLFSSAEGFVFISGLVAGMVYTKRLRRDGPQALRANIRTRANLIYVWHLAAFFAALAAVQVIERTQGYCSWTAPQLFFQNPWLGAVLGATLLYQPGLFDILPMYCAFVLLLPPILNALEAGRRRRVIGLSVLAWLAVQGSPPIDAVPLYPLNVGTFNLFAWQLLFVLGAVIGHARITDAVPQVRFRPILAAAAAGIAIYGWGVQHLQWRPEWPDQLFGISLNKPSLGALRLADFGAVAYLVATVGAHFPRLLTWRPFAFLGQHSLAVVAGQSLVVVVVLQFPVLFATPLRCWLMTAVCVAFIFGAAALHRRITPRQGGGSSGAIDPRQRPVRPLSQPHDIRAA